MRYHCPKAKVQKLCLAHIDSDLMLSTATGQVKAVFFFLSGTKSYMHRSFAVDGAV